ncbi:MAG: element excision factor XisH family protein [Acidobacteriota bacterium]
MHYAVKNALVKDGWTITDDPYYIKDKDSDLELEADLGAERTIAAEKGSRKIVVEIKSFLSRSLITDFYMARGQYLTYRDLLIRIEPESELFLAISSLVFHDFFQIKIIQDIVRQDGMSILVVNIVSEEVTQWIS